MSWYFYEGFGTERFWGKTEDAYGLVGFCSRGRVSTSQAVRLIPCTNGVRLIRYMTRLDIVRFVPVRSTYDWEAESCWASSSWGSFRITIIIISNYGSNSLLSCNSDSLTCLVWTFHHYLVLLAWDRHHHIQQQLMHCDILWCVCFWVLQIKIYIWWLPLVIIECRPLFCMEGVFLVEVL